ncbi:MAG: SPW repeat domain-containing protein, partial [Gemmatimonadaceae bacterium]
LGYAEPARTNDWIVGPIATSVAIVAIWEVTRPLRWVNAALGVWLVAAPWLLGYGDAAATINSTATGTLLLALALVRGEVKQRTGGGWSSLWHRT